MNILKIILVWLLFFFTVTFSFQNVQQVRLRFKGLTESLGVPLFIMVLAALLLGIIIGSIGGVLTNMGLRSELKKRKREMERLREEPAAHQDQDTLTSEASSANPPVE